jgi:putative spermidine/putrescine transport system substrate-binding protein
VTSRPGAPRGPGESGERMTVERRYNREEFLRRGAVGGLGLLGAGSLLSACGTPSTSGGEGDDDKAKGGATTLTFVSFGGAYQKAQTRAWIEPYMKENPNIKIVQDEPVDYAKLQTMVESGNVTWDICDVGNDFGLENTGAQSLEPLDYNVIPKAEMVEGAASKYRVANMDYGVVMAYRTDKFPGGKGPGDWAEFFDLDAFPGKRGFWKDVGGGILEFALIADGVDPARLYPLDVDRALKKLDTIKKDIVYWETGAQSAQLLADGEVTAGMSWNGRIFDIQKEKAPVEIVWNEFALTSDFFVIPRGTKNKAEAMKFIAYAVSKQNNARLCRYIPYGPTNEQAKEQIPAEVEKHLATTYADKAFRLDDAYFDKNRKELDRQFQEWLQT